MQYKYIVALVVVFCASILWSVNRTTERSLPQQESPSINYSGPEQFALLHKEIRTAEGEAGPAYTPGYRMKEFQKARALARTKASSRILSAPIEWTERGPGNVPGRTRGLIVDPDDATKNTWFAGSAGGGVWKTTNAGLQWSLLTPNLSNLSTTVLAMAPSDHNTIYVGTGEGFGNLDGISGNGIFKSIDRGISWSYLPTTSAFEDINRMAISPTDPGVVVAATNSGIYRTTDGGLNWTHVSTLFNIQDLKVNPENFSIQYASKNAVGVLKSVDAGVTWALSNAGMSPGGRIEIAVSPVNTSRIFASAEGGISGTDSDLYLSDDAGATWSIVDVSFNSASVGFLGGQGWYDNTIACDPFNANIVYFGGVNIFRLTLDAGSTVVANYAMNEINTAPFLFLQSFANIQYDNARLTVGPDAGQKKVEVRFGPGMNQFAHRFTVPSGATSGVPATSYLYANYVQVPFQVWDVTDASNPRQLMVSFRDQANNNQFDLVEQFFGTDALLNSREYTYINNVDYSLTPNPSIAVPGGQEHKFIYNFFPALAAGGTWTPGSLPTSNLEIQYSAIQKINATTITVSDAYNQFDGKNRFTTFGVDVHPDQHNLVMIPMTGSTYKILNANDGGIFVSNTSATPGIVQGNWTMSGKGYNTGQFYGADKRPGFDQYVGGLQDNGTWRSPAGASATSTTAYDFSFGGDGFEVIWHNLDDQKLIGGSQGNNFLRSINGGNSWTTATAGLSGTHPFVSKLANSRDNPDFVYALGSAGVFRSTNFGANWVLTPITIKWGGAASLMDVEVSRANANIVWAGSGMVDTGTPRNIHVSTDAGLTFQPTENPSSTLISGGITKLASHPAQENTGYALFSQAGNPKILRTTNLGQSWEDISGFDGGDVSTRGFPDVAVYCLYVRPDNTDILWAGTEIGIVESLDNGLTWALIPDFPNLSVWDMKGQDDQVVIATHGRGIWTATIHEPQVTVIVPEIVDFGTSPKEELLLLVNAKENFDRIEFYSGTTAIGAILSVTPSTFITVNTGLAPGLKNIKMIAYKGTAPFHSKTYAVDHLDILSIENSYSTYFNNTSDLTIKGFTLQDFVGAIPSERSTLQSLHPYAPNGNQTVLIRHPVVVSATSPNAYYEDIALVEPGLNGSLFGTTDFKDYVVLEASKNGLNWIPLEDGYDARFNANWLAAFDAGSAGSRSMFVAHQVELTNGFAVGDTLLFRYRLFSDATVNGWGTALDYITIQSEPTSIEPQQDHKGHLTIFPNPATREFTAEYSLNTPSSATLEVIDLFGKVLHAKDVGMRDAGVYRESFTMAGQLSGTYFVVLKMNSGIRVVKVIVSR